MKTFVLLRDQDQLNRACSEISDLFAFRLRGNAGLEPSPVIGIWIDPHLVVEVPSELRSSHGFTATQPGRIWGSVSLSGIWTLCWLENPRTDPLALLEALLETSGLARQHAAPARFVPVLRAGASAAELEADMRAFSRRTAHVLPPLQQDADSGRISRSEVPAVSLQEPPLAATAGAARTRPLRL